ncbi:REPLICATION FACTOR C / DNA polymerase III GAMMA-TAU SUBUNIT [Salix viminalis]|uniref:REPLICATION FACTOR C / DNA polymerase III GAMMA-TAU SUBUNIT n=1 Tax=Salix viminalis TaxID=40686 RepID=A0A9Q0U7I5_SALVM|nr:REPLICATION FACTOR C / DNA polymerase III GAMMA-TAU SUBUNIT [Salix viminalis]
MTKAVRTRIFKDANDDIGDHLRNHIHLTNCIHLKNHMLKQSPILADRSLMRDLIALQRSRSLRDPSASPPSWHSLSVVDLLPKKGDTDATIREGRSSVGIERRREANLTPSKVVPTDDSGGDDGVAAISDHSIKSGFRDGRGVKREESSRKSYRVNQLGGDGDSEQDQAVSGLIHNTISGNSKSKDRKSKHKGKHSQDVHVKTLSEQLHEIPMDTDVASSNMHLHGRHTRQEKIVEPETSIRGYGGVQRVKRRKFRSTRRTRASAPASRDVGGQKEMSVASNSFAQGSLRPRYCMEEEEYGDQNFSRAPRNGCGIPWNWSRIHHRGKTFLDMAGRSLSCGLSDTRKGGSSASHGRDFPGMPVASDRSSSSTKSDVEALPLLVEVSGSQESTDNAGWVHDYSGELGIYADHLLKNDIDSDLASEARSGEQRKLGRNHNVRHQNLTQKYMPRTFRDLVGQNLAAQALSNAVVRRKVGFLYVFYGPHGTGKTLCARIFARALNCQSLEHPKPCGYCNSCISCDMGKSRNIREVGPVSNFDFKSIIDLLDNMWISSKEDIDIDKDALKLIASRSDGSLRDAEMTLEQLSLLGQKISVPLVQELVGLISDEKLVDLLDLALSADTVNTVKNLRVIMETGVEPLALMSQLATVITDVLAGSYDFTKEQPRRKFFRRKPLSKEDMEKLRQALKTLSEAEKQLRMSNDKLTWLTAALLQLAPDQQYLLPSSSTETSFNHSPLALNNTGGRDFARKGGERVEMSNNKRVMSTHVRLGNLPGGTSVDFRNSGSTNGINMDRKRNAASGMAPQWSSVQTSDAVPVNGRKVSGKSCKGHEEIWLEVLEKVQINSMREFLYQEGKLISVSFGSAPTVQLIFSSHLTKLKAEKFRAHILQAFESVLGSPVTIEIRCELNKETNVGFHLPAASKSGLSQMAMDSEPNAVNRMPRTGDSLEGRSEIVEILASPRKYEGNEPANHEVETSIIGLQRTWAGESVSNKKPAMGSVVERRKLGEPSQNKSIVRSKVSLAHVIQQAEGCTQQAGWSKHKAVSIAEKLEQENLRLEPRSRSLLCWKATRVTHRKLSRLKIRTRKPHSLLKLVSCGKCLTSKSPR